MALNDWLWLIRLIIEILRIVSQMSQEDLQAISKLRQIDEKEYV